jgi:3-dehydroquinate dehydratase
MKRKYEIVVKQYQTFEFDWDYDTPLTEEDFWNDVYNISDCELDSHVVEWKEIIPEQETVIESTHPADKEEAKESLQSLIDIMWDYISEKDIPEITKRMEEK